MPHVPDRSVKPEEKRDHPVDHVHPEDEKKKRERAMDKTLADSYPASDPPSTIPDPEEDEDAA